MLIEYVPVIGSRRLYIDSVRLWRVDVQCDRDLCPCVYTQLPASDSVELNTAYVLLLPPVSRALNAISVHKRSWSALTLESSPAEEEGRSRGRSFRLY